MKGAHGINAPHPSNMKKFAKKMNKSGTLGKRGGKWTAASVLRVIRNEYHIKRNQYEKPEWWGDSHYHVDILMLG